MEDVAERAPVSRKSDPASAGSGATPPAFQIDRISEVLARAVERTCPRWLADRRDDIVQAAAIKVVEVLRRGEHPQIRCASYLWQVAHSAIVDEIRRVQRRRELGLDDLEAPALPATSAPDPERAAAGRELGWAIQYCLERLLEPRRLAVTLHLHGFAAHEAVRVLGWDLKRVRNLTYRGLADLRTCLESKGITP